MKSSGVVPNDNTSIDMLYDVQMENEDSTLWAHHFFLCFSRTFGEGAPMHPPIVYESVVLPRCH